MRAEENVETFRRFVEALESGDLGAVSRELAPKVEIDDQDIPDADGHDSFHDWLARWNESWESWRSEEQAVIPIGDDTVLALFTMFAKGKGSGIELSREDAVLAEFHDGKIQRIGYYNDQAQARSAAGLDGE